MNKDDDFWDEAEGAGTSSPGASAAGAAVTTALEGFATGGLVGLVDALNAHDDEEDEGVDDPDALRRAEEAVSHWETPSDGFQQRIDEPWTVVARQTGTLLVGGLSEVARALAAAGISIGWDPYDPADSVAFLPVGLGASSRTFTVLVPESQASRARQVLGGGPAPDGVTFAWEGDAATWGSAPAPQEAAAEPETMWPERGPEAPSDHARPTPVTSYGSAVSDNESLQRLAGGRPSGVALSLAVIGGLLVIGIVVFMLLRG
jgi:hypothetical protein